MMQLDSMDTDPLEQHQVEGDSRNSAGWLWPGCLPGWTQPRLQRAGGTDGLSSRSARSLIAAATARSAPDRGSRSASSADPRHAEGRQIAFHAGDDAEANEKFAQFAEALGFAPVLAGGLRDGGPDRQRVHKRCAARTPRDARAGVGLRIDQWHWTAVPGNALWRLEVLRHRA